MRRMNLVATIVLPLFLTAAWAFGSEHFVDQKHPSASDQNPGTEARPFKTIQAGANAAKPGDTIWVKAGNYEDRFVIQKQATIAQPITLSAWKDDRVRIGYLPRPLPTAGAWKPVEGSKSWQVELTADVPDDFVVLLDGRPILTWPQDGPCKDEKLNWAAYRKKDRTLFFNANGKDPARLGRLEYGRQPGTINLAELAAPACWWIVRKFEFSWIGEGLRIGGENNTVEDCFFTHCYRTGIFLHGRTSTIRRCNFYRAACAIGGCGSGPAHVIEDNLIVECSLAPEDDIGPLAVPGYVSEGAPATSFKGSMYGQVFQHNIMSDNPGAWYADCFGVQSCRIIGNAFWDNGSGIYNEANVNDTVTQANVFYRSPIGSSVATRWNLIDNLFFESGIFWNNLDLNPIRDGYMLLRKNAFINPPTSGYLGGYSGGWQEYAWPEVLRNCIVDHNRVWLSKGGVLINDGGARKYKTLEEVQKEFDWERHGKVQPYDKEKDTPEAAAKDMGGSVVTFRIPWGKHSGEARPMLSNSGIHNRWPGSVLSADTSIAPCYFWRAADGDYQPLGSGEWARFLHEGVWTAYGSGEGGPPTYGCRWYLDADADFPKDLEKKTPGTKGMLGKWNYRMQYTSGNFWLVLEGVEPGKMLPQGLGYWTPLLGAAPGAKINVSLRIRGKELAPTDKGSPVAWVQFVNETGQCRKRVFLLGRDDEGKLHGEKYLKGTYDWTNVSETIVAPEGAVRMAMFVGIKPCKGQVNFDDIQITTASDPRPVVEEVLLPRIPLQRFKETHLIDISKQANRRLSDEAENDGKGGWTDQGPGADMRNLKTGERRLGGVMFRLLPDDALAVIVLKSTSCPRSELPEKVTIPVGKKLDALYFLHASAWTPTGGDEVLRYVLHYADGKDVTIKVTGNNLVDWIQEPKARFPLEEGTFTTAAETVPNSQFKQGTLYRMEWACPRDRCGVELKSIEFVGGGKSVPILLAVTGVTLWN